MAVDYRNLLLEDLNYSSYLKISELLNLQQLVSHPNHHDEMFFIIIHQTTELWFKEILHETTILVEAFNNGVVSRALKTLKRISAIMNLMVDQIRLLATLTPVEFAGFRKDLGPASGFQSVQYRQIEFVYGLRDAFFLKFFESRPEVAQMLRNIQSQPSVYDFCIRSLKNAQFAVPESALRSHFDQNWQTDHGLVAVIRDIYENPQDHYHWVLLLEAMVDLDEKFVLWRKTHAVMVSRTIGNKKGTGGSAGHQFLIGRENLRCFPELWEVRNVIGGGY